MPGLPAAGLPAYGLDGSAAAAVAAEWAGAALSLAALFAARPAGSLAPVLGLPPVGELAALLSASGAVFVRSLSLQAVFLLATATVAAAPDAGPGGGCGGGAGLAAHHIAFSAWLLCAFVADALAEAAQSLVASAFGAGDLPRARAVADRTLRLGAGLGAALLGAFASAEALGPGVAAAFTDSPQVRACAALPMRFVAASQPLNVLVFIGDGVAYGAGDFAFVSAAMLAAGGLAAAEMVATSASGLLGVWRGMTLLQAGRSAGLALRYWWAPAGGPLILRPPPPPREEGLAPQRGAQPPGDGGGPPQ